ncbi:MAG: hypothetical protein IIC41_03370, partial [Candidatus Marinimicrobia bacterium]|nr:hypothetical protein [Candidatus Neomarinimicrobiota bacterium]
MVHLPRVSGTIYVLLLALGLAAPTTAVRAQVPAQDGPAPGQTQPLEMLLNPDGTLDLSSGFSGSLDPA